MSVVLRNLLKTGGVFRCEGMDRTLGAVLIEASEEVISKYVRFVLVHVSSAIRRSDLESATLIAFPPARPLSTTSCMAAQPAEKDIL
jgi:hypothetical protein